MEKVGSDSFGLFGIRCVFKEIQLRGTIERLVQDTATNVLLETRLHDIRGVVVPGNVLAIGGGNVCGHGSTMDVSWLDINFIPITDFISIYSNFVTRIISFAPAGAAGV